MPRWMVAPARLALLLAATPPSANAADQVTAPVPAAAVPGGCELHVFPAERFAAHTMGLFGGMGLIGALADSAGHAKGDQARKAAMAAALDSPSQATALASMDLAGLLHQQPAVIVRHDEALDRKTVNKIKERRATSSAPCYSEVIVADLLYSKAPIYGRSLRTLFIYRRFNGGGQPVIYKGWGGNGLKLFPPKPGEDVEAASAELVQVFKADFEEFARNASKAPRLAKG